ncbi:MAG: response regulator [Oscillatoriales cyanobacterium RU_3_3]|nr:response regulator [Oscillatoriales cyanobacterium RU_3_3]
MLKLQILLLEANLPDAEAVAATLVAGEFDCELLRVDARTDFVRVLENHVFDLILADCTLPDLDGMAALEIARNLAPETPLIFVSASIGEERTIALLEAGAAGFVLKQRLERLIPCVQRALRSVRERLDRQRTERMLLEQERLLKSIASGRPLPECLAAVCTAVSELNPRLRACFCSPTLTDKLFPVRSPQTCHHPSDKDLRMHPLTICASGLAARRCIAVSRLTVRTLLMTIAGRNCGGIYVRLMAFSPVIPDR